MTNPLHAAYYADQCVAQQVEVVERHQLALDTYLIRLDCGEIAKTIRPGQFVMVRAPDSCQPLLGRAFAVYDVQLDPSGTPACIDIVFLVVGKLTRRLATVIAGDVLEIWGPLGNGFSPRKAQHLVMVAGGIGQTPFMALGKAYLGRQVYGTDPPPPQAERVSLCYGARTEALLAGVEDFRASGVEVHVATDDGSTGHHGQVTELLKDTLKVGNERLRVVCCGPEPMMAAVAAICADDGTDCEVSLETPMACGLGICFSCVAKVRDESGDWDYKRTCVDGPVFDARRIVW